MKATLILCIGNVLLIGGPLLGSYLITRAHALQHKSTITTRLDHGSLKVLASLNGLMFASQATDSETVRYLMANDVIENEAFPKVTRAHKVSGGYMLTDFGKHVLQELGIKVFDDIIIDMHRIRYWEATPEEYQKRKKDFGARYSVDYDKAVDAFVKCIPDGFKKSLGKDLTQPYNILDTFGNFLETDDKQVSFEEKKAVVDDWKRLLAIR